MTDRAETPIDQSLTPAAIRAACGDLRDAAVIEIMKTGGTLADLEAAALAFEGDDEVLVQHPLTGAAAEIYDLLMSEEPPEDER